MSTGSPRTAHVLLVQNDQAARNAMASLLTSAGHHVTTARSRQDAHELLRGGPLPDLILLDWASVGTLAAAIAHEVNNPLACVTTNLDFVAEQLSTLRDRGIEPIRDAIAEARDAANRVHSIVRDLRAFLHAEASGPAAHQSPSPPVAKSARARVLFIDDELPLARAVQRFLGRDHDVVIAANGKDALSLLERDARFDIIFCDLMMPTVTGIDLYGQLRLSRPEVLDRIVFMTGGAFTPGAQGFLGEVPNPHLEKPFDLDRVRQLVSEALERG